MFPLRDGICIDFEHSGFHAHYTGVWLAPGQSFSQHSD
jgi:hypothetical protein